MVGEPKDLDFGKKELGKNLEERAVEGEKTGDAFRKEFPTVFGILNKGIDYLKKDTPEIKEKYPKELIDKITKIVRDGGFDDFLVDSGDKAVPIGTRFPFNFFLVSKSGLKHIEELYNFNRTFLEKGLGDTVENLRQNFEGKVLNTQRDFFKMMEMYSNMDSNDPKY